MSQIYTCSVCDAHFKYKRQYDEHVITCEIASNRCKERRENIQLTDDQIPNPRLMYELLKIALQKCANLEQEVEQLKKIAYKERKKIDIMEYLHGQINVSCDYNTFMDRLRNIQPRHLQAVFNGNIADGVIALIADEPQLPFVSFSHKQGIYNYLESSDEPPKWEILDVGPMFEVLSNRFIGAYREWSKTVPELNDDTEDAQNKKVVMFRKILGTYISDDFKYQKLKSWLYNHVKRDVKSIVEYEF